MTDKQKDSDKIIYVRGFPIPKAKWIDKKMVEEAMDHVPDDDDIIIASFPKTGSNWLRYIILQIISKGTSFPSMHECLGKIIPNILVTGTDVLKTQNKPRIYKHHLPYNLCQKNDKAKIIYIYRHPEDTMISFYHFFPNLYPEISFSIEEITSAFATGNIVCGNYFQHVLSFYEHREDTNLLMVSYEKLHANTSQEILRIAKFLGDDYHTCLLENEEILKKILEHTSFEYMKKNLQMTHQDIGSKNLDNEPKLDLNLFRKGVVGDGKSVLKDVHRQRVKEAASGILKETDIIKEWYSEKN